MKSRRRLLTVMFSFLLVVSPVIAYAATESTVAGGALKWIRDSYVQQTLSRHAYSKLVQTGTGSRYRKKTTVTLGGNTKTSGFGDAADYQSYTELFGNFWDAASTYYDYE